MVGGRRLEHWQGRRFPVAGGPVSPPTPAASPAAVKYEYEEEEEEEEEDEEEDEDEEEEGEKESGRRRRRCKWGRRICKFEGLCLCGAPWLLVVAVGDVATHS